MLRQTRTPGRENWPEPRDLRIPARPGRSPWHRPWVHSWSSSPSSLNAPVAAKPAKDLQKSATARDHQTASAGREPADPSGRTSRSVLRAFKTGRSLPITRAQPCVEPGTGVGPLALGGALGQAQGGGGILQSETGEKAQVHQPGGLRILSGQLGEGIIECDELFVIGVQGDFDVVQIDAAPRAAAFEAVLVSGPIEGNAPHRSGGGGEEVAAIVEVLVTDQAQIGFMNQGRRFKGLARLLLSEPLGRKPAQLVVDQRQELVGGVRIA